MYILVPVSLRMSDVPLFRINTQQWSWPGPRGWRPDKVRQFGSAGWRLPSGQRDVKSSRGKVVRSVGIGVCGAGGTGLTGRATPSVI